MTARIIRADEGEKCPHQFIDEKLVAAGWGEILKTRKEPQ
jgi:hypothetical protein